MWLANAARARFHLSPSRARRTAAGWAAIFAALTMLVGAAPSYCGDDSNTDTDWEQVNQVLEIPQACTKDGIVISCDESLSNTGQVPGQAAGSTNNSEETETASTGSSRTEQGYDTPDVTSELGSVDDYENQEIEEMPVYAGMPMGGYGLRPSPAYATPSLGPSIPTLAPAWTRPPFGTGPWMIPPSTMIRPAAPMTIVRPPFPLH